MAPLIRADELMVSRGMACDTHKAGALIMAGQVRMGSDKSIVVDKAGMLLSKDAVLSVKQAKKYVSRGGVKLEGALRDFGLDVTGLRCADLGASTGGFTDCLLQQGAESVCAVDVGYGQLAHRLQIDPRVAIHDRTNIRTAEGDVLGAPFDLVVADLSFIGIGKVAYDIARFLGKNGRGLLLVKPQFEARRTEVGARGLVSDKETHLQVLKDTISALGDVGLVISNAAVSSIRGATGNIEFWLLCGANELKGAISASLETIVESAHR